MSIEATDHTETAALEVPAPLTSKAMAALLSVGTATITTQLLSRGFRNTFLEGLTVSNRSRQRMVGEAFTMRSIPAREDIDVPAIFQDYDHPQRKGVESVQPGQVLVIDSRGRKRAASLGHILATRLRARGAAGIVTDGSLRDMEGFETLDRRSLTHHQSRTAPCRRLPGADRLRRGGGLPRGHHRQ